MNYNFCSCQSLFMGEGGMWGTLGGLLLCSFTFFCAQGGMFAVQTSTASLSAKKGFLGGGVVKNNPIFVKQILLHHIYANIWEFI